MTGSISDRIASLGDSNRLGIAIATALAIVVIAVIALFLFGVTGGGTPEPTIDAETGSENVSITKMGWCNKPCPTQTRQFTTLTLTQTGGERLEQSNLRIRTTFERNNATTDGFAMGIQHPATAENVTPDVRNNVTDPLWNANTDEQVTAGDSVTASYQFDRREYGFNRGHIQMLVDGTEQCLITSLHAGRHHPAMVIGDKGDATEGCFTNSGGCAPNCIGVSGGPGGGQGDFFEAGDEVRVVWSPPESLEETVIRNATVG